MNFDLHTHSTCSDGALSPADLLARAVEQGVTTISITDHDTVAAYKRLPDQAGAINIVAGIELSTRWYATGVHIVGLNIDPRGASIRGGVDRQSNARLERAAQIGDNLARQGMRDCFDGALALAEDGMIGRPHFAQHLLAAGHVDSVEMAFKKYLGDGKAGDVRQHWAELPEVISWIRDAGGIAVLAHPLKYRLTRSKLKRLLKDFIAAGGQGLEVVSGNQLEQRTRDMGGLCREFQLLASRGSDFHTPGAPWSELGRAPELPHGVTPVWDAF